MPTDPHVTLTSFNPVAPPSITEPIAKGFEDLLHVVVERRPIEGEPPAAGMSEVAMWVDLAANASQLITFLGLLAQNSIEARRLRHDIRTALEQAKQSPQSGRRYAPFALHLGTRPNQTSLRFYLHGYLTDEEVAERLSKAQELAASLPVEAFSAPSGPQEYGFYWDAEAGHWRGELFYNRDLMSTEGSWFPPDLWTY